MKNRLTKRLEDARLEGGFTLIELLIVIVILGILAAIVVFAVGATRGDAVAGACKTDVSSIQLAADAGKTKLGKYPSATQIVETGGGLLKSAAISQSDYIVTYAQTGSGTGYTISFTAPTGGLTVVGTQLDQSSTSTNVAASCAKA